MDEIKDASIIKQEIEGVSKKRDVNGEWKSTIPKNSHSNPKILKFQNGLWIRLSG
jgi:hypothetical protein